jgi:hypothetical protein
VGIVTGPGGEFGPPVCPCLADSGVYLLGALVPRERADYAGHLGACPVCRREVDELAHLPALLNRVTAWFVAPREGDGDGDGDPTPPAVPGGV